MQIACIDGLEKLGLGRPDVIAFPERVTWAQVRDAERVCPNAVIVGAVLEDWAVHRSARRLPTCRAVVMHEGGNRVDYLKIRTDGTSVGVGREPPMLPVYRHRDLVLGVVICMDLEESLAGRVINDLRGSTAPKKLLCVPAAMSLSAGWTLDSPTASRYDGIHFAVSNRSDLGDPDHLRVRSLMRDPVTRKFIWQEAEDALFFEI